MPLQILEMAADRAVFEDAPQGPSLGQDLLDDGGTETFEENFDGAKFDRLFASFQAEHDFPVVFTSATLASQDAEVDASPVESFQGRSHVGVVDEQGLGRLGHLFAFDLLQGRQRQAAPGIKFIQRMRDGSHAGLGGGRWIDHQRGLRGSTRSFVAGLGIGITGTAELRGTDRVRPPAP